MTRSGPSRPSARIGSADRQSRRGCAGTPTCLCHEAFAAAGFTVELPRLPGHGTSIEDMITTGWDDWSGAVEAAYTDLAARCTKVVVAGLSMGGTLTTWLAARHPEIAGIVLVNPAVEPPADSFLEALEGMVATGTPVMDAIGSDVADPDAKELAYAGTPIAPLASLFGAVRDLQPLLAEVRCPVLLFTSVQDHVVPPSAGDHLAASVGGPVERVMLERSYHVATLDYDKAEIESRSVEFAKRVSGT